LRLGQRLVAKKNAHIVMPTFTVVRCASSMTKAHIMNVKNLWPTESLIKKKQTSVTFSKLEMVALVAKPKINSWMPPTLSLRIKKGN
jgi:hypothetical protein